MSGARYLNTPRLVADASGVTVWRHDNTEPFSDSVPDENPSELGAFDFPLRFLGQYFDKETGLAYNYFRDYDPVIGRYVQSDPIGLEGGINTFAYVAGNALGAVDPLGLAEIYRANGVTFHSYPGPQAGGDEHARHGAGQSYHIHLRDPAGNVARVSTETWKPLTPDDERIFKRSKQMQAACEQLTEGEKKFFDRVNREIFHRGRPTLGQLIRLGGMRGGGRGSATRGSE